MNLSVTDSAEKVTAIPLNVVQACSSALAGKLIKLMNLKGITNINCSFPATAAFVTRCSVYLSEKQYLKLSTLIVNELLIVNCKKSDHLDDKSVHGDPEVRLGMLQVLRSLLLVPQFAESRPLQPASVIFNEVVKWENDLTIKLFTADCVNIVNCMIYPVFPVRHVEKAVVSLEMDNKDEEEVDEEEEELASTEYVQIVEPISNGDATKNIDEPSIALEKGQLGEDKENTDTQVEEAVVVAENGHESTKDALDSNGDTGKDILGESGTGKSAADQDNVMPEEAARHVTPLKNLKSCSVVLDYLDVSSDESVKIQTAEPTLRRSTRKRTSTRNSEDEQPKAKSNKSAVSQFIEIDEEVEPYIQGMMDDFKD